MAEYLYDGVGVKRQVIKTTVNQNLSVANGRFKEPTAAQKASVKTTDYAGNIIYENGTLNMILTGEGYITLSGTTPTYHYYLKDHQGNKRVVVNQSGTVTQVNHYYPFGGVFGGEGVDTAKQPFKYNDKEFDRTNGLDLYDYSARFMDAALGRFTTVDPLAEKHYNVSPYAYCLNNPIMYIDPLGQDTLYIHQESGRLQEHTNSQGNDMIFLVDDAGNRGKSLTLSKNAIQSTRTQSISYKDGNGNTQKGSVDIYKVRGDNNSTSLFEFLADNFTEAKGNPIEFGHFMTGEKGDNGLGFITTTGLPSMDKGGSTLINGQLHGGYTIRSHTHNHPANIDQPSGLTKRTLDGTPAGKWGDMGFKNSVNGWYSKTYPQRTPPIFKIYLPGSRSRISY